MFRPRPSVSAQTSRFTTQRILIVLLSSAFVLSGVALSTSAALRAKLGLVKAIKPESVQQPQSRKSTQVGTGLLRFAGIEKTERAFSVTAPVAPTVTATKTDSLFADADNDTQADPGDTIKYTVNISASGSDATGVTFTDNVDPNTTFVPGSLTATPVAVNDTYSALGNVRISVAAPGVLGNDFTGVPTATITGAPVTSANGGNVTLNPDGSFTYNPPAGFEGTDSFTYTLTNAAGSNNATVTISVNGMIWFIDNNASCPCDGRLTNPFNSINSFQAVNNGAGNNPAANDNIFIYESGSGYTGSFILLNGQKLIGQDASASLSSITGLTPPPESDPLPVTNSANGTIVNISSGGTSITVAQGNTLRGFTGGSSITDISGSAFGTLTISDVTLNGIGQALNLTNGTLAATFGSISSLNSTTTGISLTSVAGSLTSPTTTITNPTGSAITVNTSSGSLNFGNTNASGSGSTGVSLTTNTGAITFGSLSISPAATQRGLLATDNTNTITTTSGDITTTTGIPVQITRAAGTTPLAVSLTSVSSSGATNGIILTNTSGSFTVAGSGSADSGGIITQSTGSANNADPNGKAILLTNASNVTLRFMKVSVTTGNASAILATDISGTNSIEKSLIDFNNSAAGVAATAWGLRVFNTNTNTTVNVDATTFQNKTDTASAASYSINGNSQVSINVTDNNTADTFDSKYTGLFPSGIVTGCGDNAGSTAKCFFNVSNTKFINAPSNGVNNLEMTVQQSATLVPNISNNTFDKVGLPLFTAGVINVNTLGSGRLGDNTNNALFTGNTITNIQSGAGPTFAYTPGGTNGYIGMRFGVDGNAGVNDKVKILNNNIRVVARQGILISARGSRNDVNFLLDGNTVGTAAQPVGTSNRRGTEIETQSAASLKIQVSNNVSFASSGSSNTNSSLHFRAGVAGGDTGTLFATVTGNNITNSNPVPTGGRFKAETVSVGSGSICLDLANNTLDAATKEFNLVHASTVPGVFNFRNGGGNVGTVTTSGTITNIVTGCTTPVLVKALMPDFGPANGSSAQIAEEESESAGGPSASQIAWNPNPSTAQSPGNGKNVLQVLGGELPEQESTPHLTQAELNAKVLAAIQRLTDAGLSEAELANLQQLTFEVANLPDDQLASTDGNVVRIDETAAGYGWFSDATPLEDSEFDVLVPDKERQASELSPAFGKIDLLTVVMRQLRMAAGEVSSEGAARWLTQATLPAGTRRAAAFKLSDSAKAKTVPNAKQSATIAKTTEKRKDDMQQIASANAPRNARVLRNHAARTPMSFADVMLNIGTLPAGESVTITFNATVNNPFTSATPSVSNQGTVSGSNFANVLTDDPTVGGAADPTVTPIDLPAVSVAVSPSSVLEDGATNLTYTFTRTGSTTNAMTVNFNVGGTASFSSDYTQSGAASFTATNGTVTFGAGSSTAVVTIDPSADTTVEPDETVSLTVTSGTGYTVGSPSSASGTITNDDTDVSVAVSPASVTEDGATNLVYTFTRVGATSSSLTVNFNVGGTATFGVSPDDYTQTGATTFTTSSGSVTFAPGSSTATVTVNPETDSTVEPDETVALTLAAGTGYNVASPSSATGTIINDDTDVSVAVSPASVAEDGATNLTYTFSRVGVTTNSLTVNFSVGGSAGFGSDYTQSGAASFTPTTGTVTFSPGSSTAVVTIDPSADSTVEPDETVDLTVTAGAGYNVGSPNSASGTIVNDDTDVSVAVSPASVSEDGATNLVYTFTRAGVTSGSLTVNFSVGGTATFGASPNDYTQTGAATFTTSSGTVTFGPGNSTATVTVNPEADTTVEPDETVDLTLTAGAGYNVGSPSSASGTITNDDTDVSIAVSPASVAEDGATNLVYIFTRNGVTSTPLTVNFNVGGTANFGSDYSQSGAATFGPASGTVTFGAGNSTATVTVDPTADTTIEPDETVSLTLTAGSGYNVSSPSSATGTITNDDADVSVTVSPAAVAEDGATNLIYTFTRTGFTAGSLTVNFSVGGTATFGVSPNDYTVSGATTFTTTTGSVTFAPGSSTAQITVDPETDTTVEPDETVVITLTAGASYNAVSPDSATGTILNDDTLVSVVVSPSSTAEGGAPLVYTFTRTGPTTSALTVNFSVGGSASFPADYTQSGAASFATPNATVTFGVGSSTATVTVTPLSDCVVEGNETVDFTVQPGTGYGVGSPASASGTITNTPDSTPPTITLIPNLNNVLWPPDHSYHSFTVSDFVASVNDGCDGAISVSNVYITKITSDEVENGNGDGNTLNDIVISGDCKSFQLRAERDSNANGRVYTIFFAVKDSAGNVGTATTTVVVPKNSNETAVDSGPHYTVNSSCP